MKNPWLSLELSTKRRINFSNYFDFFWIIDEKGRYGLTVSIKQLIKISENSPKLRGIEFLVKNITNDNSEIYLIIKNNSEWQIFLSLCNDLLENSSGINDENRFVSFIIGRLLKWQKFLSQNNRLSLTEQQQMGLVTELFCLMDFILPHYTISESINSWVGPEFDKQDFSLLNFSIEVKSFISSKGNKVRISSLNQLDNKVKRLYLLTFGITKLDSELLNIPILVKAIKKVIEKDPISLELFEYKLAQFGYMEGITESPFYSFSIDSTKCYFVCDEFPKIISSQVKPEITAVEYSIDLSRCSKFQIDLLNYINTK